MYKSSSLVILGGQYLHVADLLFKGLLSSGNVLEVFDDFSSPEESIKEYEKQTMYSDFRIMIPALFNFYHGLELTLKGMIRLKDPSYSTNTHSIDSVVTKFHELYGDNEYLKKYVQWGKIPTLLKNFLKTNKFTSINNLYQALRYSTDTEYYRIWNYSSLRYTEEDGENFVREFHSNLDPLRESLIFLYKEELIAVQNRLTLET